MQVNKWKKWLTMRLQAGLWNKKNGTKKHGPDAAFFFRSKGQGTVIKGKVKEITKGFSPVCRKKYCAGERTIFKEETMSVQAVNPSLMNVSQILPALSYAGGESSSLLNNNDFSPLSANNGDSGLTLTSEQYFLTKTVLQYQNKDGDSVMLSTESVDYQKAMLSAGNTASKDDWKEVVDYMKQQYVSMKEEIIKSFLKSNGVDVQDESTAAGTFQTDPSKEIPGLPEYWNAENTSQRIVDFATSFYSMFKGSGQDFLAMIKDAIDKGFSQAKDILGDLPDAVSKLASSTHDLVMKKIDEWAQQQGISTGDDSQTQEQTVVSQAA